MVRNILVIDPNPSISLETIMKFVGLHSYYLEKIQKCNIVENIKNLIKIVYYANVYQVTK